MVGAGDDSTNVAINNLAKEVLKLTIEVPKHEELFDVVFRQGANRLIALPAVQFTQTDGDCEHTPVVQTEDEQVVDFRTDTAVPKD
jgi:hypothetical protein